jgi:co-chaperonin GroES (HSP10)
MNLQPLYDNIIVQLAEESNKTASGLFLTSNHDTTKTATVVAVGPGRPLMDKTEYQPLPFTVGATLLIKSGAGANGYKFKFEGTEYLQIDPSQVIGVL